MKQMKSFRLNDKTISSLEYVSEKYNMSQTEIIEKAVNLYWWLKDLNETDNTLDLPMRLLRNHFL